MLFATRAILILTFVLAFSASACQSFEDIAATDIQLRNDTRSPAVVEACRFSSCNAFRYTKHVPAGASVAARDIGDGRSWWLVLRPSGRRVGCLSLDYTHRVEGYVLRLSKIVACP